MALSGAIHKPASSRPGLWWLGGGMAVAVFAFVVVSHAPKDVPMRVAPRPAPVRMVAAKPGPSAFAVESQMTPLQLMARWEPLIVQASKKYAIPAAWIRDVMRAESGGRTMLGEGQPIISDMGAQGLMQLLPGTFAEMRAQYGLGANVFDPRDNIFAGAAYLKWLEGKYGFPGMFAAYNDGPGLFEEHLFHGRPLPDETRAYVAGITKSLGKGGEWLASTDNLTVTRPDGSKILLARADIKSVRAALPGEYAGGVLAVVDMGRIKQGVLESPDVLMAALSNGKARRHA